MSLKQNSYLAQYQDAAPEKKEDAANDEEIELEFGDDDFSPQAADDSTPPPSKSLQPRGPVSKNGSASGGPATFANLDGGSTGSRATSREASVLPPQRRGTLQGTTVPKEPTVVMPDDDEDGGFGGDWDNVNSRTEAAVEKARKEDPTGIAKPITFIEAYLDIWRNQETMWKKYEKTDRFTRNHASVETGGFWGCLWSCMHSEISEKSRDYEERDFVLCLMQVPLERNTTHHRILMSVYRKAVKPKRTDPDPPSVGAHWERDLGFQGDNPGTDLRTQGVFGLLQMLALLDSAPLFADKLHQASLNVMASFAFSLICLFFSGVSIESMQKRLFHDEITKRSKQKAKDFPPTAGGGGGNPAEGGGAYGGAYGSAQVEQQWSQVVVAEVMNDFHVGSLYHFFREWTKEPVRDAFSFPTMKNQLKRYATEHVAEMIKNAAVAKARTTWVGGNKSAAKKEKPMTFSSLEGDKDKGF